MVSDSFKTYKIGNDSLVIKSEPVFASQIEDFSNETTSESQLISYRLMILFQNKIIHATLYKKENCIVFESHPKKIFNDQIPLVFRLLKEIFLVSDFFLKDQFEK